VKKAVIILIALIYIASVALVSFFGLQFKVFEEVIPVDRVEITNQVDDHNDTWGDYVGITQPNEKGEVRYQINYHVYPENATNTEVSFSYQASPEDCATIDEFGVVSFTKPGMIKVFVITTDGGDAQDTITILSTVTPTT
jgi:hypothetical protein